MQLAEMGRGFTSPNPLVGAVIVKDGSIIAEGYHRRFGEPHAEIEALNQTGDAARGSTVYVTLEPCCHYGKTPPCTRALIDAGVTKVVMAMEDPNPLVAGMGKAELEAAGILVETGILVERAKKINEWFIKFTTTGVPFFLAKAAMTLDGKISTRAGHSRWITGQQTRQYVHWLRAGVDAVMVGSKTVQADDPMLTTRLSSANGRDPIRLVIDGNARISPQSKLFKSSSTAPAFVIVKTTADHRKKESLRAAGAELLEIEPKDGKIDLLKAARELGKRGIASVMIEGGGALLAAAFEAGIVDKALFFVAPKIFGGKDAPTPVEGTGVEKVEDAVGLRDISVNRFGDDIVIEGYVIK